jgi:hypothetical protein
VLRGGLETERKEAIGGWRELRNEVLRGVTVGGTLGSGVQWPVRRVGI